MDKIFTNAEPVTGYRVFFTNFGYFASEPFDDLQLAKDFAKSKGFEATIYLNNQIIGTFSPISGYTEF